MYQLLMDGSKCKNCGTCWTLLPGFDGFLQIDETSVQDEEIRAAAERVKVACPNEAINFKVKV